MVREAVKEDLDELLNLCYYSKFDKKYTTICPY